MPGAIVVVGNAAGLASAFALAQLGHDVTILDRDPQPAPVPWNWPVTGSGLLVPQSRHSDAISSLGVGDIGHTTARHGLTA
jgi:2-polyprenyl-6-methoxyphenol hydroxylase-like FAD-dependent oxidoreductase